MARTLKRITVSAGSSRKFAIDCRPQLDSGETITGITIDDADGLTISNEQASVAALVINGETVPTAQAVEFFLDSPAAGDYTITFSLTTSSSPIQTQIWDQPITAV